MKRLFLLSVFVVMVANMSAQHHINFNSDWYIGTPAKHVTLPRAWNEDEAFRNDIADLSDSVVWYRKSFRLTTEQVRGKKVFVEFEGIRHAGEVYINDLPIGIHENGVMACGFDLTEHLRNGKNMIEVRTDNDWNYHEKGSNSPYQWNNKNFNANYGGVPKNVWLHIVPEVYQTLPLYSNLGTKGVYVYATDMNIAGKSATIHLESEVRNDSKSAASVTLTMSNDELNISCSGEAVTLQPGETRVLTVECKADGIDWWTWGHGKLYDIISTLRNVTDGTTDEVVVTTGFRKTRFAEGKVWLNDRVLMMKGYAQRTSNEWPGVGMSVPAWLSDYSNALMVKGGANLVRWMHVTPWKQDIESCDRVGLIQAMPAGDAERDVDGRRWEQRTELMRDAIIYNRNNPSILFYEGGNESISREHMNELKAIRDLYDPHGGRAIGSREMLDIDEAEYGGEMLYINKSAKHPMWAMEYCRDEGLRKNWDEWSYPYHREGDGPLYKNQPSREWHHNQDQLAIEWVRRWYDYWRERPGTGTRVSSGGVKIVFSDTNTHHRGSVNYRTSGATDALRIEKDGYFAHQVMWHGWVENDGEWQTHIIGHWNYESQSGQSQSDDASHGFSKPVYVVSNSDSVQLYLNGRRLDVAPVHEYRFLYTFPDIKWEPGTLEAVSYDKEGREQSRHGITSVGEARQLKLTVIHSPYPEVGESLPFIADGADIVLLQVEVVDAQGRRCPLDDRMIHFTLAGPAEWRGGIATGRKDNYVLSKDLPVECGINRAMIRSTCKAGRITIKASADGLPDAQITLRSVPAPSQKTFVAQSHAHTVTHFIKGEQPLTPSYVQTKTGVKVISAKTDVNQDNARLAFDDNELSEWKGGHAITFTLERPAAVDDVCLKLAGWRNNRYPLEVYAGDSLVWKGVTPTSLGYVHLEITAPVKSDTFTIRIADSSVPTQGNAKDTDVVPTELGGGQANELDRTTSRSTQSLRIVEAEFLQAL